MPRHTQTERQGIESIPSALRHGGRNPSCADASVAAPPLCTLPLCTVQLRLCEAGLRPLASQAFYPHTSSRPRPRYAGTWPLGLCRVPRLDKCLLRAIRVVLGAHFLDRDLGPILCEDDVLFFHLADAALGELVGVEVDLGREGRCQYQEGRGWRCDAVEGGRERRKEGRRVGMGAERKSTYLVSYPAEPRDDGEQDDERDEVAYRAHRVCCLRLRLNGACLWRRAVSRRVVCLSFPAGPAREFAALRRGGTRGIDSSRDVPTRALSGITRAADSWARDER